MPSRKRRSRHNGSGPVADVEVVEAAGDVGRDDAGLPSEAFDRWTDLPVEDLEPHASEIIATKEAGADLAFAGEVAAEAAIATVEEFGSTTAQAETQDQVNPLGPTFDPAQAGAAVFEDKIGTDAARASDMVSAFSARALEAWRTNAEAVFSHWMSLSGVRTVSEAISLNSAFARKQIETLSAQSRDLAAIAARLRRDDT